MMRRALALSLFLALAGVPAAQAAALRVSPVGLELPPGQAAAVLTLRNDDVEALNVQVRVFKWTQRDGRDVLEPATDVVASPPIGKVAPGASRTVRIVRLSTQPVTSEETYRLIVDELPPPLSEQGHQVKLLMRHSVPLFFSPGGRPRVDWTMASGGDGQLLNAVNGGDRHMRLANVKIMDAAGAVVAERKGLVGYVLPGASMAWPMDGLTPRDGLHLVAETDLGPIDAPLPRH